MELLGVYDDKGERTVKVVEKSNEYGNLSSNEHIGVAIIYIENNNGDFLIQKTSKQKGSIYSATGGHIEHDELPIDAIMREVKEELGIDISGENIVYLGHLICDFPVRFLYYLKKDIRLSEIVLQVGEVESVSYMSINEIKKIIEKGLMHRAHSKILEKIIEYKKKPSLS